MKLEQIVYQNLNTRFIKEGLTLTPKDIYEELQKSVKDWLQQKQKCVSNHSFRYLVYKELLKELDNEKTKRNVE